jgi:predicted GIY-YIG superfamily endonuclease
MAWSSKEAQRDYYQKNKERLQQKRRESYRKRRLKELESANRRRRENIHRPLVYLLPKEDYVGTTSNLKNRLSVHKSKGRNTGGWIILAEFEDRAEALKLESFYHNIGYNGKHKYNVYK